MEYQEFNYVCSKCGKANHMECGPKINMKSWQSAIVLLVVVFGKFLDCVQADVEIIKLYLSLKIRLLLNFFSGLYKRINN
jgi:hypothetical protein